MQMPIMCFLFFTSLVMICCRRQSEPERSNVPNQWVNFDSLLMASIPSDNLAKRVHCDIRDTTFELNNDQITHIDFKIYGMTFKFRSHSLNALDSTIASMEFNNIKIQNLFDDHSSISSIDMIAGLNIDSDSIMVLNYNKPEECIILISGNYPKAYGKFSYVQKGLILQVVGDKCFAYLLSGDTHTPGNFYLTYDKNKNVIRYLKIKMDTDAIDMDVEETYTIIPTIINLQSHNFRTEKNNNDDDKNLIVKSKNYYENTMVKVVSRNW